MTVQRGFAIAYLVSLSFGACGRAPLATNDDPTAVEWSALLDDGDASMIAPDGVVDAAALSPSPRTCPGVKPPGDTSGDVGDCTLAPLAFWSFDDCNARLTQLADSATTSSFRHAAFRAVSTTCVPGATGQGIGLAGGRDVVYAPDQTDFNFDRGITIATWINADSAGKVQTIARKRLDGSSSFLLALDGPRVVFVARLINRSFVALTAPMAFGRLVHVAATYDGQQAILYIDGAQVAATLASGTIAPGAGPIFFGNDADGRKLHGMLDEVWLNSVAAPPDVIRQLSCRRLSPVASFTPSKTIPQSIIGGATFDLTITDMTSASCFTPGSFRQTTEYHVIPFPPPEWRAFPSTVTIWQFLPGQTFHIPVTINAAARKPGIYRIVYTVQEYTPDGRPDGGANATLDFVIDYYTFDTYAEQWFLNPVQELGSTPVSRPPVNLVAHPAPGTAEPTLAFNAVDGFPDPGSLMVSATFTAHDQYIEPITITVPAVDLTGQTLHAWVRLVSGPSPQGGLQLYAGGNGGFPRATGLIVSGDTLMPGVWTPLELDFANPVTTMVGFDSAQVFQIGVRVSSGTDAIDGTFVGGGETVLEIDTVVN